jgi:hypothetical protein
MGEMSSRIARRDFAKRFRRGKLSFIGNDEFNPQLLGSGALQAGSYASEFPLVFDNINGSGSRLVKIMGVYANVDNVDLVNSPSADSYGQPTGQDEARPHCNRRGEQKAKHDLTGDVLQVISVFGRQQKFAKLLKRLAVGA